MAEFLKDIKVKKLPESMARGLDEPINELKIRQIISKLKNNKSPVPDGYTNEFYKAFVDNISSPGNT